VGGVGCRLIAVWDSLVAFCVPENCLRRASTVARSGALPPGVSAMVGSINV